MNAPLIPKKASELNPLSERAKEALKESEARFSNAFEYAPIGMALVSLEGRWLKVNRALCDLIGFSEAELLARTFQEMTHPDDLESDLETVRQLLAGKVRTYQIKKRYFHARGHLITVLLNVSLVRDELDQPRYFVSQIQDITERERGAAELWESKRFLRSTLNALSSHIAILDEHGTIIEVNAAWNHFASENNFVGSQGAVGANYLEVCDSAEGNFSAEAPVVASGIRAIMGGKKESFHLEYPCHSPKEKRWFIVRATRFGGDGPMRVVVAHDNITERKQAENALRESHEQFHQLADHITDAFWIRSPDLSKVHYISPAFEKIWGRSTESLYANPQEWADLVFSEDRERVLREFATLTGDGPSLDIEYRIVRPNGEIRWVQVRGFQVRDAGNKLIRLTGIVTDITDRKSAENTLARTEELYRRAIASADAVPYSSDYKTRSYAFMGEGIQQLIGYAPDEVTGQLWKQIIQESIMTGGTAGLSKDEAARQMALGKISNWRCDMRVKTRDGKSRWISDASVQNLDESGRPVGSVGILQDITDRKQGELSALAFSKLGERLSSATSASQAFVIIKEVSRELFGWDAFWINLYDAKRGLMYKRFSIDTVEGQEVVQEWSDLRKPTEFHERIIQRGEKLVLRDHLTTPLPGTIPFGNESRPSAALMFVPIRSRSCVVGILSVQSYVPNAYRENDLKTLQTLANQCGGAFERIWAEEARLKFETQFRLVWNASADGMRLANRDGIVLTVNECYCKMVNKTKAELEGQPFSIIHQKEDAGRILQKHRERMDSNTIPSQLEKEVTLWDGRKVWLELSNSLLHLPGEPSLVLSIFRDISARKRAETQLFQSQKMETVGKLAAGVAHEFNSILTAIIGQSELLLSDLPSNSPLAKNASEINHAAIRAATLTAQLLAYGRKQMLQPEILNLNSIVASMESTLRHLMGETVNLRVVPAQELKSVKADAGQIEQVIMNIAMNAADVMPNGGNFTLETANVTFDPENLGPFPELKSGDYVMLALADTGPGMSDEIKSHVFEPFFTTKPVGEGTGLGLSSCYGMIKQSGGHITVYSEPGRGTTFKIYLPQVEPFVPVVLPRTISTDLPRGTETILLVEDDPALREMASMLLRRLGYTVLPAANGVEALNLKQQRHIGHIDLLFTDVVMPHMSGKELADRILATHPQTRILFTSAYTENAMVHQGGLNKGVALLQKPFTPSALAHKLREVFDQPASRHESDG